MQPDPSGPTMTIQTSFPPCGDRAVALNARMNRELGLSLEHVCEEAAAAIEFDREAMAGLIAHLLEGRCVDPATFARYYDLVDAIYEEDVDRAKTLLGELSAARCGATEVLHVVTLGDDALGDENARYIEMMNADPSGQMRFQEPPADVADAFRGRLAAGLDLLDAAIPELAREVRAIVRQIVISGSDPKMPYQFDGGSHFQLWGALFLNGKFHPDTVAVVEVLAHESAHSLLFGFCTDEPLTLNEDDELFASPLRHDKRPMDGIYHATFVSARMHWAMTRLAESDRLCEADKARALEAAATDLNNFDAGYGVIAAHGRLSDTGRALIQSAKAYVDSIR